MVQYYHLANREIPKTSICGIQWSPSEVFIWQADINYTLGWFGDMPNTGGQLCICCYKGYIANTVVTVMS